MSEYPDHSPNIDVGWYSEASFSPPRPPRGLETTMNTKTYGELYDEIDHGDKLFDAFCRGWNHAVWRHAAAAAKRLDGRDIDPSEHSQAQKAQLWGFYTGQIAPPT